MKAIVATLAFAMVWLPAQPGPRSLSVADLLDQYSRGAFGLAVDSLDATSLNVGALTAGADRWIEAGGALARPRRRMVAAAFALEVVWAATRRGDNADSLVWDGSGSPASLSSRQQASIAFFLAETPVAGWGCVLLSPKGPAQPAERWWWLTSVAMFEDAREWRALVGAGGKPPKPPRQPTAMARDIIEGHLTHARARFPDEPRWRLAEVVARAGRDVSPVGVALASASVVIAPAGRPGVLNNRSAGARSADLIPQAVRDFEALARDPAFAGEAEVHLGYLELRRQQWAPALAHLDRARSRVTEPFLLAVTDYLTGWIDERLKRPDDAIAAYRRAHDLTPRMRDLSTLFAAQLFQTNQRPEAYAVLDALNADPALFDLLPMFERGDARLVPEFIRHMREALR
jgi:tetratricopeptide (TPR) repeat protein